MVYSPVELSALPADAIGDNRTQRPTCARPAPDLHLHLHARARTMATIRIAEDYALAGLGGAPFYYDESLASSIAEIEGRVEGMRRAGRLTAESLRRIRRYFRLKDIYHSNAIEGNTLNVGETRQVVELGLTIAGRPLKDQAEAKNLSQALDFFEDLAAGEIARITAHDIRQVHHLILQGIDDENAGAYRSVEVTIAGSNYRPPPPHDVEPEMRAFFDWLGPESEAPGHGVIQTAAAAHAWFAQIHPFIDGNGRTARILMNLVLMRSGYPIAIVTKEDRMRYYDALEESQAGDLTPLIKLIAECVSETLEEYEDAVKAQQEQREWLQAIAARFDGPQLVRVQNEYEVWRGAMTIMLGTYRDYIEQVNMSSKVGTIHLREFGMLEFEKYVALRQRQSAKGTWFFRLDFVREDRAARYLHTFRWAHPDLSDHAKVSVRLGREVKPFQYDWLGNIASTNVPSLREVAYSPAKEAWVSKHASGPVRQGKIEDVARGFLEEVMGCHFAS